MPQDDKIYVIYIHGFMGSTEDFDEMRAQFAKRGYHASAENYSTFKGGVEVLSEEIFPRALAGASDAETVHIVTHSMGALLLRSYLSRHVIPNLGRSVMAAPANHGSEVADKMSGYEWWVKIFGGAGLDLRTGQIFPPMPEVVEFGVIAGTASWNYLSRDWIKGEDDGWVGVESTKLAQMRDFVEVEASHGLICQNESVINQTQYFLEHGHFASNIVMDGTPIDVNSFEELRGQASCYIDRVSDWYRRFFRGGDTRRDMDDARAELEEHVHAYQEEQMQIAQESAPS